MRKFVLTTALSLAMAALAVSAHAAAPASQGYFQAGVASAKLDSETFSAVHLNAGVDVNKYLALEAGGDVGLSGKTYNYNGANVKIRFDYDFGAYVVGKLPVSSNVDLLGRVGYIRVQGSGAYQSNKVAVGDSGVAYGVGLRYFPNGGNNGVSADLTHYDLGKNSSDGDLINISYVRRF